jgi:hypothetical protein
VGDEVSTVTRLRRVRFYVESPSPLRYPRQPRYGTASSASRYFIPRLFRTLETQNSKLLKQLREAYLRAFRNTAIKRAWEVSSYVSKIR